MRRSLMLRMRDDDLTGTAKQFVSIPETEDNFCSEELVLLQDLTSSVLSYLDALLPQEAVATTAPVNFNGVTDIQASLDARHREVENTWEHAFHAGADNTSCLQLVNNPELCAGILNIYGYIGENADRIDEMAQVSRDCFETYVTDAKWEEGWKHVAVGAFAIMSGVSAIGVAASGSGALLTVLGYTSGTASGVFGSMELFEGMQNVTISLNGMKYTDAVNPLKSAMGEDAYNMGLFLSTATADVVTGVGAVKNRIQKLHGGTQITEVAEKTPKGGNVEDAVEKLPEGGSVENVVRLQEEVKVENSINVDNPFYKQGGGSNIDDFMSPHSRRHAYNPNVKSTRNKTQFGKNIDVAKLQEDTLLHPDKVTYDADRKVIKYAKEYGFNISTADTPTGSHRVFINLEPRAGKTNRNTQFPYFGGKK